MFRCFFDFVYMFFLVPCLLSSGLACGSSGLCRVAFVTVPTGFDPLWWGGLGPGCSLVYDFYVFYFSCAGSRCACMCA